MGTRGTWGKQEEEREGELWLVCKINNKKEQKKNISNILCMYIDVLFWTLWGWIIRCLLIWKVSLRDDKGININWLHTFYKQLSTFLTLWVQKRNSRLKSTSLFSMINMNIFNGLWIPFYRPYIQLITNTPSFFIVWDLYDICKYSYIVPMPIMTLSKSLSKVGHTKELWSTTQGQKGMWDTFSNRKMCSHG